MLNINDVVRKLISNNHMLVTLRPEPPQILEEEDDIEVLDEEFFNQDVQMVSFEEEMAMASQFGVFRPQEFSCQTPNCNGSGHVTGLYSSHRSKSGCPLARRFKREARLRVKPAEPEACPTPGCKGEGHITGRFSSHRRASGCPLKQRKNERLLESLKRNLSEPVMKFEVEVCATPGCDGTGHVNGTFLTHRTQAKCPMAKEKGILKAIPDAKPPTGESSQSDESEDLPVIDLKAMEQDILELERECGRVGSEILLLRKDLTKMESQIDQDEKAIQDLTKKNLKLDSFCRSLENGLLKRLQDVRVPGIEGKPTMQTLESFVSKLETLCDADGNCADESQRLQYETVKAALKDFKLPPPPICGGINLLSSRK